MRVSTLFTVRSSVQHNDNCTFLRLKKSKTQTEYSYRAINCIGLFQYDHLHNKKHKDFRFLESPVSSVPFHMEKRFLRILYISPSKYTMELSYPILTMSKFVIEGTVKIIQM
jgi:hypothetical protein